MAALLLLAIATTIPRRRALPSATIGFGLAQRTRDSGHWNVTKHGVPHRPYGVPLQHVEEDLTSFSRRSFVVWHVLPVVVALGYFAVVKLAPGFSKSVLSTEQGLIEIAT